MCGEQRCRKHEKAGVGGADLELRKVHEEVGVEGRCSQGHDAVSLNGCLFAASAGSGSRDKWHIGSFQVFM